MMINWTALQALVSVASFQRLWECGELESQSHRLGQSKCVFEQGSQVNYVRETSLWEYVAVCELRAPTAMMTAEEQWGVALSEWVTRGDTDVATVSAETGCRGRM